MKDNKGITLVTLGVIIGIIGTLMVITVMFTFGEDGIIKNAEEMKFKAEVTNLIEEYNIKVKAKSMDINFNEEYLYASKQMGNLKEWILNITEKYENKIFIEAGIMYGNAEEVNQQEIEWLKDLGIDTKQILLLGTSEIWELGTTDKLNDTIVKYNHNAAGNYSNVTVPNKVIDSSTGVVYDIKYVGDGTNAVASSYIVSALKIEISEGLILSQNWSKSLNLLRLYLKKGVEVRGGKIIFGYGSNIINLETEDNVTIKNLDIQCSSGAGERRIKMGNNCTIGTINLKGYFGNIELGENNTLTAIRNIYSEYFIIDNIKIGDNSTLGNVAFYQVKSPNCYRIQNMVLGNNVQTGSSTFSGCTALEKITIGDGTVIAANTTFSDCTGLKEVILGNATIPASTFKTCTSIEKVTINEGAGENFGSSLFNGITTLNNVIINKNVTLSSSMFTKTGIQNLVIPQGTILNATAFSNCTNLNTITIKPGVQFAGVSIFSGCTALTTVNIENGVEIPTLTGGRTMFNGCSALENITLPNSIKYLSTGMFVNCKALKKIIIEDGENTIEIGSSVVNTASTNLELIHLPSSTIIDTRAFGNSTVQKIKIEQNSSQVTGAPWGAKTGVVVEYKDKSITY